MKKKTLLYMSDFSLAKTGFARHSKALLTYLHNTNKYNIIHYCCGMQENNPDLQRTPWKSIGCLPSNAQEMQMLQQDPNRARLAAYGSYLLDKTIKEYRPDVAVFSQDFWGVDFAVDKKWFDKISSVIHTTLDSLPILPSAIDKAVSIKNYWVWADFAEQALHKLGHKHVKTVYGAIDSHKFFKLPEGKRKELRDTFNIPQEAFIVGYVFRNQLRKSIPNLLQGYKEWKNNHPEIKNTYLLFHTFLGEGWNIPERAKEFGIDSKEIICTYICRNCGKYEIKSYDDRKNEKETLVVHDKNCPYCKTEKAQITTNVGLGVTESQLNEVYNLMDVFVSPFTSGGLEFTIYEAKLCEIPTLVTNYSCGTTACLPDTGSLPLEWAEYREPNTEFIKASTYPSSIAKQINKVYNMTAQKRAEMGSQARAWTLNNLSAEVIGKKFEDFIDSAPLVEYDFNEEEKSKNPQASIPNIQDNLSWVKTLYKEILLLNQPDDDSGVVHWCKNLEAGMPRRDVEAFFRQVATQENQKNAKPIDFEEILGKEDKGRRIIYVMPESCGDIFMSTALFPSIHKLYPNHNLYVAVKPQFKSLLELNPYVYKVLDYMPQMDSQLWLEGNGSHEGYFEIAYLPFASTQRFLNYLRNGKDKININLNNNVDWTDKIPYTGDIQKQIAESIK